MNKRVLLFAVTFLFPVLGTSQEVCPCIPMAPVWIATPCDTWNCAQAAMIVANGDPFVVAVPTSSPRKTWIVLRRTIGGAAAVSPDNPFEVQSFSSAADGAHSFGQVAADHFPVMVTTVDGKTLVVRFKEAQMPAEQSPQ
jgi:hypothetical protein